MSRRAEIVIVCAVGLLVAAGIVVGLLAFHAQQQSAQRNLTFGSPTAPNALAVEGRVAGVDPQTEDMTVRLSFLPTGRLAGPDRITLSRDLRVAFSTAKGRAVVRFQRGELMNPQEITVSLDKGDFLDYPFDSYKATLVVYAEDAAQRPVPVHGTLKPGLTGFTIEDSPEQILGQPVDRLNIERVTSTTVFAVFVMVLLWALAIAALAVALSLAGKRRVWNTTWCTFLAALLFAFPAVRNALPGAPPIGALFDFLSFYWAEALVALSLLIAVFNWAFRSLKGADAN